MLSRIQPFSRQLSTVTQRAVVATNAANHRRRQDVQVAPSNHGTVIAPADIRDLALAQVTRSNANVDARFSRLPGAVPKRLAHTSSSASSKSSGSAAPQPEGFWNESGANESGFKLGLGLIAAAMAVGHASSDEQKEKAVDTVVSLFKGMGVTTVEEQQIRRTLSDSFNTAVNCTLSSPAFYGAYQLIHSSPSVRNIGLALAKGATGSVKVAPMLAGFYGVGALLTLGFREVLERRGTDPEVANDAAQAITYLGIAAPAELIIEANAVGVSMKDLGASKVKLALGTLAMATRLATGVLLNLRKGSEAANAAGEGTHENVEKPQLEKAADALVSMAPSIAGTSASQHLINAIMYTTAKKRTYGSISYFTVKMDTRPGYASSFYGCLGFFERQHHTPPSIRHTKIVSIREQFVYERHKTRSSNQSR